MPAQKVKLIIFGALVGALFLISGPKLTLAAMEFKLDGIENNPSEINYDQSIDVLYSFNNVIPIKIYYLAGVFQQSAGSYYFGYTWNNNWYKYGDDYTNFYKLEITESSVSGKLKIKPDVEANGFNGTGEYQFKIGRYSESGKSLSWSDNNGSIMINYESPPSPEPATSPSPTPIPIPSPAPSLSPSVKPSLKPTPQLTPSPDSTDSGLMVLATESGEVLGTTESAKPKNPYLVSIILSLLGIVLVGGSGLGFYLQSKKV